MQGVSFKVPVVNRSPLDLHQLFKVGFYFIIDFNLIYVGVKIVTNNGGFEEVCSARKWVSVAREVLTVCLLNCFKCM